MPKKKKKKERKQKKKLTPEQRREKKRRQAEFMTVFINGKQKQLRAIALSWKQRSRWRKDAEA